MRRAARGERGAVAGLDGVMFGILVLVAGTVLIAHAWSVIEVRRTLDGAAREYLRAYTEADSPAAAAAAGQRALDDVVRGERGTRGTVAVDPTDPTRFGPCSPATVSLSSEVPAVRLPFLAGLRSITVTVTHTELVDAHREMTSGPDYDPERTPCAR